MTETPTTISTARQRREELRQALIDLESVISSPARAPDWISAITKRTKHVREALDRHTTDVEGPDGIINQIVEDAPHLASHADQLRAEHPTLAQETDAVLERLRTLTDPDPAAIDELRDEVLSLLGQFSRHRQRGVDLVYDALDVDIGGQG